MLIVRWQESNIKHGKLAKSFQGTELMQPKPKKVLLLYTDKYYFVKQIYPFGLDIIADYLRRHSYDVTIDFPFLPETDPETNLIGILERENPDLIGLGLRNIDTCMACEKYG